MTTLAPKNIQFKKDYSEQQLSSKFVSKNFNTGSVYHCDVVSPYNKNKLINQIENSKHTLIIATDILSDNDIIKAIKTLVENHPTIRVYLCLGDDGKNKTAIDKLKSRCLIRTGVAQAGTMFLSDHQYFDKQGIVITEFGDIGYYMMLNPDQIDDSYRSFCKHFWDSTKHEYFGESKRAAQTSDAIIVLNDDYQLSDYFNRKSFTTLIAAVNTPALSKNIKLDEYATIISNRENVELNRNAKDSSANIVLIDFDFPNIVFEGKSDDKSEDIVWLLPKGFSDDIVNWAVQLDDKQKKSVTESIYKAIDQACWELVLKPKVSELVDVDFVSANNTNEELMRIDERKAITLEENYCKSIEEFLNEAPETLFSKQTNWSDLFAAQHVTFSGVVHPFYCPKNAIEDKLVNEWDKVNSQWLKSLSQAESMLNNLIKELGDSRELTFSSLLKRFVLGQNQQHKKMIEKLAALKTFNIFHSTPAQRKTAEDEFSQISLEINQNKSQISKQINLAEKVHVWNKISEQLSTNKEQVEKDVNKAKVHAKSKKTQLETLLTQIDGKYSEAIKTYISEEVDDKKVEIPKEASEFSRAKQFFANKNHKKQHPKLYQVHNRLGTEHQKAQKELAELNKKSENIEKNLASITDEIKRHEQNKPKPESLDESLDKQLGLKGRKLLRIIWPSEELPKDDLTLMQDKGKRYLVIQSLDEYDEAKKEASRLGATVCTFAPSDVYA
jgi:hypothetical protein